MSDPNDNNTDQPPTLIQEHSHHQDSTDTTTVDPSTLPKTKDFNPRCPFCIISVTYPPIDPLDATSPTTTSSSSSPLSPTKLEPPSFILLTTPHAIAFLDIMPLTRGHVLVAPRHHRVKLGDMSPTESAELGRLLPIVARGVLRAVLPDIPHDQADYNIVQNNGPGAAQVVPHVHFHVVPRPPFGYVYPEQGKGKGKKYPPNKQPEPKLRNAILFGRGMREDLDWDEAEVLVEEMRRMVAEEWRRVGGVVMEGEERAKDARKQQKQRGDWKV
ncbi:hypothetical protein PV10_08570 [Exophiala mesophila]|uniref:HIT domain-containing protein n=1 Tax=Exophiala mesophila TaxID=212818 RepID=A0A0D1Z4V6_EXOME|nr:uncharacterized protein PV10_08570 [Exophiala mesophila]KIV88944.1 hypothetical protein PV10_08570 [Exophiala mesophila]